MQNEDGKKRWRSMVLFLPVISQNNVDHSIKLPQKPQNWILIHQRVTRPIYFSEPQAIMYFVVPWPCFNFILHHVLEMCLNLIQITWIYLWPKQIEEIP